MASALVLLCVDPRLNHELLRIQVRQQMARLGLQAHRIYLVNEIGGNLAPNFDHTLDLLVRHKQPPVFAAVLHHNDCIAHEAGLRTDLPLTVLEATNRISAHGVSCPIYSGQIDIASNAITWDQSSAHRYRPYRAFSN
jgi:hypothetical protein